MRTITLAIALLLTSCDRYPQPEPVKLFQAFCAGWQGIIFRQGQHVYTVDRKRIDIPSGCVYAPYQEKWKPEDL